ncbi:hypothetical protein DBR06_SOUSAS20810019, partial [Sousa chinensis]
SHLGKLSQGSHSCCVCSKQHSLIWNYGLNMGHQCFCQYTEDTGFIKSG